MLQQRAEEEDSFLLYLMILLLYDEGVEPTRAEILFKLREYNATDALIATAMDHYSSCEKWYAVSDDSVRLKVEPKWFRGWVNLKSQKNEYSPQLWLDFLDFLISRSLDDSDSGVKFNQTRYSLSKELKKRSGVWSLEKERLGVIAHMIQLSLQQHYLCYEGAHIIPAWMSLQTTIKDKICIFDRGLAARAYQSVSAAGLAGKFACGAAPGPELKSPRATAEDDASTTVNEVDSVGGAEQPEAREELEFLGECLKKLLQENDRLLLSQVRLLLAQRYDLLLDPGRYGYSKLSNLLVDKFPSICRLVRHRNRHVYLEAGGSEQSPQELAAAQLKIGLYSAAFVSLNAACNLYSGHPLDTPPELYQMSLHHCLSFDHLPRPLWTVRDLHIIQQRIQGAKSFYFFTNDYVHS